MPYLLGEPHPLGRRLVDVQACLRTNDIDEVGDASHLTFFEMLGNWSLGDYFKAESLAWSYEFLTTVLGLPAARLSVTVFAGDSQTPRDDESAAVWQRLGMPTERIYSLPKDDNWWGPVGRSGPCGPRLGDLLRHRHQPRPPRPPRLPARLRLRPLVRGMEQRFYDVFTSAQFIVKFDLWNEHQPLGDARSAEIWMCGATALVP